MEFMLTIGIKWALKFSQANEGATMKIEIIPTDSVYAHLWMQWRSETNAIRFNPIVPSFGESWFC